MLNNSRKLKKKFMILIPHSKMLKLNICDPNNLRNNEENSSLLHIEFIPNSVVYFKNEIP